MKSPRFALWSALATALLASQAAVAQERFSTITGTVADKSGAAIPGVSVTLTHLETRRSIARTTDANGSYAAREIESGRYSIRCELSGFATTVVADVNLQRRGAATGRRDDPPGQRRDPLVGPRRADVRFPRQLHRGPPRDGPAPSSTSSIRSRGATFSFVNRNSNGSRINMAAVDLTQGYDYNALLTQTPDAAKPASQNASGYAGPAT